MLLCVRDLNHLSDFTSHAFSISTLILTDYNIRICEYGYSAERHRFVFDTGENCMIVGEYPNCCSGPPLAADAVAIPPSPSLESKFELAKFVRVNFVKVSYCQAPHFD